MEKRNSGAPLVGMQIGAATIENSMEGPQNLKNVTALYDPAISLLRIYLKKPKTLIQKNIRTPIYVHCTIIYYNQDTEPT